MVSFAAWAHARRASEAKPLRQRRGPSHANPWGYGAWHSGSFRGEAPGLDLLPWSCACANLCLGHFSSACHHGRIRDVPEKGGWPGWRGGELASRPAARLAATGSRFWELGLGRSVAGGRAKRACPTLTALAPPLRAVEEMREAGWGALGAGRAQRGPPQVEPQPAFRRWTRNISAGITKTREEPPRRNLTVPAKRPVRDG